jgi:hypothetical protein
MKEVKKSPKKLAAYINRTVGQAMKSPKGIYHRKKLHHLFENACYRKKKNSSIDLCCSKIPVRAQKGSQNHNAKVIIVAWQLGAGSSHL